MRKTKIEFEMPTWLLVIIYISVCSVFGTLLGCVVGFLLK